MQREITLVDRGRGLQLSTSRITVHDMVPYFQEGCSHDELVRWLPSLTHEEIGVVGATTGSTRTSLISQRRVRATAQKDRVTALRIPEREGSRDERLARLKQLLHNDAGRPTVKGLVADANIQGQVEYLVHACRPILGPISGSR